MPSTSRGPSGLLIGLTVVSLVLAATACNPFADSRADTESVAVDDINPPGDSATGDPEPTGEAAEDGEPPEPGARAELPDPVALDMEMSHPSGSQVRLNGISFTQSAIEVDVTIINGYTVEQMFSGFGRVLLEDDLGNTYGFLAPEDNEILSVDAGEQLEGTLVFAGRLPAGATSLRLVFNPENDSEDDAMRDVNPRVEFEGIPIRAS